MAAITEYSIDDLLRRAHELEASDLHITPGTEPVVRVRGKLQRLEEFEKLTPDVTRELVYRILSTSSRRRSRRSATSTSPTPFPASRDSASTPSSSGRRSAPRSA